jgi:hypothetical protein
MAGFTLEFFIGSALGAGPGPGASFFGPASKILVNAAEILLCFLA